MECTRNECRQREYKKMRVKDGDDFKESTYIKNK